MSIGFCVLKAALSVLLKRGGGEAGVSMHLSRDFCATLGKNFDGRGWSDASRKIYLISFLDFIQERRHHDTSSVTRCVV